MIVYPVTRSFADLIDQIDPAQIPAGTLPRFTAENRDIGTLAAGSPVTTHTSGTGIVAASANDASRPAVGLLTAAVAVGVAGTVQTDGPLTLADWTAIVGVATLAPRAVYFLSLTVGLLTTNPPTGSGQVVQEIGQAVSTATLNISIREPILM